MFPPAETKPVVRIHKNRLRFGAMTVHRQCPICCAGKQPARSLPFTRGAARSEPSAALAESQKGADDGCQIERDTETFGKVVFVWQNAVLLPARFRENAGGDHSNAAPLVDVYGTARASWRPRSLETGSPNAGGETHTFIPQDGQGPPGKSSGACPGCPDAAASAGAYA